MLPLEFKERMTALLGDRYPEFEAALELPAIRAIRLNRIKYPHGTAEDALGTDAGELWHIPYVADGYVPTDDIARGLGNHPAHHAGIIYIQDAGAMAVAASVDIPKDAYVADLCASPGGKSTQIAAMLSEEGFLLSNEFIPKRAKILVGNIERMGIRNACVTSLDTSAIGQMYSDFFHLVIVDAPCSGEGMFRKGDTALDQWSRENVAACAVRQKQILDNSAKTVKDGGYLLYSTCTYSYEENELQVLEFLKEHPDYTLCPLKAEVTQAAAAGTVPEGTDTLGIDISLCARFYPHLSRGEGQFIALMRRSLEGSEPQVRYKDGAKPLSREEARLVQEFFKENLTRPPRGRLAKYGDNIVLISHGVPLPPRSVFSAGVLVGEVRGRMLFPSHQLFSAYGCDFSRKVELCDSLAERYIRGEEIEAPEGAPTSGFAAITYKGAVIGGGKISAGRIKNHYPKGLRRTGGN